MIEETRIDAGGTQTLSFTLGPASRIAFDVLEVALGHSEWLAGPAFSIADLNVAGALYRALFLDLAKWPKTQAWLARCWARPAAVSVRKMRE